MTWRIIEGDCVEVMAGLDAESVDAVVCDPPYGLVFMGKGWDQVDQAWHEAWAREALRVLKPGGHLLAFGGTRTYHRLACAIEDAGFEIRDTLAWMYGSGFPKSHNLDGAWQGWGTALKPAHEPIVMARKPLAGTVAANVQEHGTGALNVDACRIETDDTYSYPNGPQGNTFTVGAGPDGTRLTPVESNALGRWPANVILDAEAGAMVGAEARFMYCPKPDRAERNVGLDGFEKREHQRYGTIRTNRGAGYDEASLSRNTHPTVKPVALMQWLCRLVTPPKGLVLDPFLGSGTTGMAALREGFSFIGIEREAEYVQIARARIIGDAPLLNTGTEA